MREKPEQDKGGDSPGDRAEHPQHALLQGLADARQADHEHGEGLDMERWGGRLFE